jgi:hypothetical protein
MDKFLNKAIENELVKKPSQDFSDKVMTRIFELKDKKVFQPLISNKIWILAFVGFASIIGVSVLVNPQDAGSSKFDFISKLGHFISTIQFPKIDFFMNINLLIISGVCLALFLLLFFDLVLFHKK